MLQWINSYNKIFKTTAILGMAVVFFVVLFPVLPVHAEAASPITAETLGTQYAAQTGLAGTDIRLIVANIIRVALGLIGIVLVSIIIYAGFLWMTAGGNEDQIVRAKAVLKNAVIGLAIILSAYSIVLFIMNVLGIGQGGGVSEQVVGGTNTQNFQGSGALGSIIKDHYPARNQLDVPRNTKIVITFRRPVLLSSFVDDTNGNGQLGDCLDKGGAALDWKVDCDQLKPLSNDLVNISQIIPNGDKVDLQSFAAGATVLATSTVVNNLAGVYTIVIRPNDFLGSASEKLAYLVHLGNGIKLDDPANNYPTIFTIQLMGNNYYEWQFTCDTAFDYSPPHVISVTPNDGATDYMNTAIHINFSEPMDPTGLQGAFADGGKGYYVLQGNNIFLKSDNSALSLGNFNIVNNYQTLEFIPSTQCGTNTCGGKIFCMNVCDQDKGGVGGCKDEGNGVKSDLFGMVVKAAETLSGQSFESKPTGAADLAGNALDSEPLGKVNQAVKDPVIFGDNPDNYFWSFRLKNIKYDVVPYLQKVAPGIDFGEVRANQKMFVDFSAIMLMEPMYGIAIEEYPAQVPPLCKVPSATFNSQTSTTTIDMNHCPFLDGRQIYYLPKLSSDLTDIHFMCFNPGRGPGGQNEIDLKAPVSSLCDNDHPENCCATVKGNRDRIYCCNGLVDATRNDIEKCVEAIKKESPLF